MNCQLSGINFKCPHYRTYWNWYNDSGSFCDYCFEELEEEEDQEDNNDDR